MQPSDDEGPKYYSPRWFGALLRGRLSFGDTFFAGVIGPVAILLPVGFVLAGFVAVQAPQRMDGLFLFFALVYALYVSALLPAVWLSAARAKVGGWRWVGIALVLGITIAMWGAVVRYMGAL
ncbi:MAG: hypothetical protein L3J37_07695 [Rhodobacteraceae bacterium]|nr:hypothetical protein [Paracoccaceae bacterium]